MQVLQLRNDLIEKKTLPWYVFYGLDEFVINAYIDQIGEVLSCPVTKHTDFKEAFAAARTRTLTGETCVRACYHDDYFFENEPLWDNLNTPLKDTMVIVSTKVPDDFLSRFEHISVEFSNFDRTAQQSWVTTQLPDLHTRYTEQLLSLADNNYSKLEWIIDKIICLQAATGVSVEQAYISVREDIQAFDKKTEETMFSLVDLLIAGDHRQADKVLWQLYSEAKTESSFVIGLLHVFYTAVRSILIMQVDGGELKGATKRTDLNRQQVERALPHVKKYSDKHLQRIMKLLYSLNTDLLQGKLTPKQVVEIVQTTWAMGR
jgi:DNA polymerase III delta subunit